MNDLNLFIDVLNNQVLIPEYRELAQIQNNSFNLLEDHPDAVCRSASFKGENCDKLTVFKFDKSITVNRTAVQHPLVFFRHNDVRCLNDFMIFYPFEKSGNQYLFVVLCNMKSANSGNNQKQLSAGEDFAKYLVSTTFRMAKNSNLRATHEIGQNHNIEQNISVKYVKLLFSSNRNHNRKMKVGLEKRTSANYGYGENGYIDLLCNGSQICDLDTLAKNHRNRA